MRVIVREIGDSRRLLADMNRNNHICDKFWGEDFNSKQGFKTVNNRMKTCIDVCNTVLSVVRQRARYEDDFSKMLMKNFKPSDCNFSSEIGSLCSALNSLCANGEKIAAEHLAAAKELSDCAERIQKFLDAMKAEWRTEKDKAKKAIQDKQRQYDKTMHAKRAYHDKSRNAEQAEVAAKFGVNSGSAEKASKLKQDASRAETAYREAVSTLNETRDLWERDLHRYFTFCEEKDKERIKLIQNEVWILTNILSSTYVAADKCCEDNRAVLEKISPEADIKEFIEKNQTGSKRPAAVQFETYTKTVILQ